MKKAKTILKLKNKKQLISVLTTLYNSEEYTDEFHERMEKALKKTPLDYEICFVNDGSPDRSLENVISLKKKNNRIKIIDLSRNFGHHKAILTGLEYCKGDYVFLIDIDLEEPPELLNHFWDEMNTDKSVDMVFGIQDKRRGGLFERLSGEIFYRLYNSFSSVKIVKNQSTVRLMKKNIVDSVLTFREVGAILFPIMSLAAYNTKGVTFFKQDRKKRSNYSFKMKTSLLISSLISTSAKPLEYIFQLGIIIIGVSIIMIGYVTYKAIFYDLLDGWASIITLICFFGGLILFSVGIIGMYISEIFIESKSRPKTIIKNIYNNDLE